jgi:RsiW-degrading membrane proteinase PrsW (M82 family)
MILLLCIVLCFVPALLCTQFIYNLDRYEQEPKTLVIGVFFWGALVSTTGAIFWLFSLEAVFQKVTGSEKFASLIGTALFAPIIEESLKGIAVLLVFLLFYQEFDSVLDGIVYATVAALGFAATENVLYLYFRGYKEDGLVGLGNIFFLRVILGAWNHAVYTAFIGIGLALVRLRSETYIRFLAPIGGWILAIFTHSLHNSMLLFLAETFSFGKFTQVILTDWFGWGVIFGIALWATACERKWIEIYLREEIDLGTITERQYDLICKQAHGSAVAWRKKRFYQLCGELALKKYQFQMKREPAALILIESLRKELTAIAQIK